MTTYALRGLVGGTYFELPDFKAATASFEFSDVGAIDFDYPLTGVNAASLVDYAQVMLLMDGIEVDNGRFILGGMSGNEEANNAAVIKCQGKTIHSIFQSTLVLGPTPTTPTTVGFVTKTAGEIVRTLFLQAQARGAMQNITFGTFSNSVDSNSVAWGSNLTITYDVGTPYLDILRDLVDKGLVEFKFVGSDFRMYKADTMGTDTTALSTPVALRTGVDFVEAPFQRTTDGFASDIYVQGETTYVRVVDGSVTHPFGRQEGMVAQGGTDDTGTLTLVGNVELNKRHRTTVQKTRKMVLNSETKFFPMKDFKVSDYIFQVSNGVAEKIRIRMMTVEVQDSGITNCNLVLNDKILEQEIIDARRLSTITGGAVSTPPGGTGGTGNDTTIPNAPAAPSCSSTVYTMQDGSPGAVVSVTVTPPSTNTDGSAFTDISTYLVRWRYVDANVPPNPGAWQNVQGTTSPTVAFSAVRPGVAIEVQGAVSDTSNHISAWSTSNTHTTTTDSTAPPVPTTPTASAYLGSLGVVWNGLFAGAAPKPDDFKHVEVHIATGSGFTPDDTTMVGVLTGPGKVTTGAFTYGVTYYAKLRSVDTFGNKSAATSAATATPVQATSGDLTPGVIADLSSDPVFVQYFGVDSQLSGWEKYSGSGTLDWYLDTGSPTVPGVLRMTGGPTKCEWRASNPFAFDPRALYRIRGRLKVSAADVITSNAGFGSGSTGWDTFWSSTGGGGSPTQLATISSTDTTVGASHTFTCPAAATNGTTVVFAIAVPTSLSSAIITCTIGVAARVLSPVDTHITTSGYSLHLYSFQADAASAGSTITWSYTGGTSTRFVVTGGVYDGLASATPVYTSKGSVTSGSTHTAPTIGSCAVGTVEMSFMGEVDSTSPFTGSTTVSAGVTRRDGAIHNATSPGQSVSFATNLTPLASIGSIGNRTWTATDTTPAANTSSFGAGWTIGYAAASGSSVSWAYSGSAKATNTGSGGIAVLTYLPRSRSVAGGTRIIVRGKMRVSSTSTGMQTYIQIVSNPSGAGNADYFASGAVLSDPAGIAMDTTYQDFSAEFILPNDAAIYTVYFRTDYMQNADWVEWDDLSIKELSYQVKAGFIAYKTDRTTPIDTDNSGTSLALPHYAISLDGTTLGEDWAEFEGYISDTSDAGPSDGDGLTPSTAMSLAAQGTYWRPAIVFDPLTSTTDILEVDWFQIDRLDANLDIPGGVMASTVDALTVVTGTALIGDTLVFNPGAEEGYVLTSDPSGSAAWRLPPPAIPTISDVPNPAPQIGELWWDSAKPDIEPFIINVVPTSAATTATIVATSTAQVSAWDTFSVDIPCNGVIICDFQIGLRLAIAASTTWAFVDVRNSTGLTATTMENGSKGYARISAGTATGYTAPSNTEVVHGQAAWLVTGVDPDGGTIEFSWYAASNPANNIMSNPRARFLFLPYMDERVTTLTTTTP